MLMKDQLWVASSFVKGNERFEVQAMGPLLCLIIMLGNYAMYTSTGTGIRCYVNQTLSRFGEGVASPGYPLYISQCARLN